MNKYVKIILNILAFFICIKLIINNQAVVGINNLLKMLLGLSGLLCVLYFYNRERR